MLVLAISGGLFVTTKAILNKISDKHYEKLKSNFMTDKYKKAEDINGFVNSVKYKINNIIIRDFEKAKEEFCIILLHNMIRFKVNFNHVPNEIFELFNKRALEFNDKNPKITKESIKAELEKLAKNI